MLNPQVSTPIPTSNDREARVQALMQQLRGAAEATLRSLAESLVDLPEDQAFGAIEFTLRDHVQRLAATAHQTGLQVGKKRGM
jgi:hypothetical protein